MQIHQLKPIHKKKKKKRVGRGGKRGTYSGKGIKGQKARSGARMEPVIRGLIKKYPKLKGYRFKIKREKSAVVNIRVLNQKFEDSDTVSPKILLEKKIIRRVKGKVPRVKILGQGKLEKSLIIKDCQVSESAKEKIEKAGGAIK